MPPVQLHKHYPPPLLAYPRDRPFHRKHPGSGDLAAYGHTDRDAVAHVTKLVSQQMRAAIDDGQPVPPRRQCSEMPSHVRSKEVGRAMIAVEVGRGESVADAALSLVS